MEGANENQAKDSGEKSLGKTDALQPLAEAGFAHKTEFADYRPCENAYSKRNIADRSDLCTGTNRSDST